MKCQTSRHRQKCRRGTHESSFSPPRFSLYRQKFHAHRRRRLDCLPCRCKASGLLVDPEDHNVVAVLIRREQKRSSGIDAEIAWYPALRLHVLDERQRAVSGDREDGNRIMPPIRSVQKFTGRMNLDFRRGQIAGYGDIFRQRRRRLDLLQHSCFAVVVERRDSA